MATLDPPEHGEKPQPLLNAFLSYLTAAYEETESSRHAALAPDPDHERVARSARSAAFHAIAAVHAAGNSCLYAAGEELPDEPGLVARFARQLKTENLGELTPRQLGILVELDVIAAALAEPGPVKATRVPEGEPGAGKLTLPRSPLKKLPLEFSNWNADYAAVVLGLAVGFLKSFFTDRCRYDSDRLEALLGVHLSLPDRYLCSFDKALVARIAGAQNALLGDLPFVARLGSERWKIDPEDLECELF